MYTNVVFCCIYIYTALLILIKSYGIFQNFRDFMKENRVAPAAYMGSGITHLTRAQIQLERMTKCWPLIISETILFSMQEVGV